MAFTAATVSADTEDKRRRRAFWRTVGGKDACKYYMFKNDRRRKRLRASTGTLKTVYIIAGVVSILALGWFAVMMVIWLMGFIILLGPLIAGGVDAYTDKMMGAGEIGLTIGIWALLVFTVLYVIRFIVEWSAILAESKELKKNAAANGKYLKIAAAVKRVKIYGLVITLLLLAAVAAAYFALQGGAPNNNGQIIIAVAGVLAGIALLSDRIYSYRILTGVCTEIESVRNERREAKAARNSVKSL